MEKIIGDLRTLAEETIRNCTFNTLCSYFGEEKYRPLLLPSGDNKYKSFWVRDCAMMAESGLLSPEQLRLYVEIIAVHGQNGAVNRELQNGLCVPPYAVADHINYDAGAVYFPGTYASGENQGNGRFGFYPPFCDNFYFVILTDCYIKKTGDREILSRNYGDMTLYERLSKAVECYGIDAKTGLCKSEEDAYTVDWGFTDVIRKTGLLLMSSLLRWRAAGILAQYCPEQDRARWTALSEKLSSSIISVFYDEATGWLWSATGRCHQHDVWITAYAASLGLLKEEKSVDVLRDAYIDKTAVIDGYVRQILTTENSGTETAWDCDLRGFTYQNGGYWATPVGWYAKALAGKYPDLAKSLLSDFLAHTEKYKACGAPYEWINEDTTEFSGCRYGTSGVLPYTAFSQEI